MEDTLKRQIDAADKMRNGSDSIIVYSDYEIVWENEKGEVEDQRSVVIGALNSKELIHRLLGRQFGLGTPVPLHVNNTLISASVFERHRFDERFEIHEDIDFFFAY